MLQYKAPLEPTIRAMNDELYHSKKSVNSYLL